MSSQQDEQIIGLIPAAGKGLRLGLPYPKELYPIIRDNKYKPVAQHVLENMTASGVRHLVFVINETKHQLMGYFASGERFGCRISYAVQEPMTGPDGGSSGLAEALDAAYHLTAGSTVAFGMADTIITPAAVFAELAGEDADVVLGLFPTENPEKFGMVDVDENGDVRCIIDKPAASDLRCMWGCILWRPAFTEHLHEQVASPGPTDFATIMNAAIDAGLRIRAVEFEGGGYIDVGTYEEIASLEEEFRD